MSDDPYLYPDSKTLKNKYAIEDFNQLEQLENNLSSIRILDIKQNPIEGQFDYIHLCAIHKQIFQDIYEWAGEPRTIGVSKSEPLLNGESINYPHPDDPIVQESLDHRAEYAFGQLAKYNYLKGLDASTFSDRLVNHALEIWEVHPFREGNTRTTLVFIDQLAQDAGYPLQQGYSDNIKEVRDAFILATGLKSQSLRKLFNRALGREFVNQIAELKVNDPESYEKLTKFGQYAQAQAAVKTSDVALQNVISDSALQYVMSEFQKGKGIPNVKGMSKKQKIDSEIDL